ncbi:B1 bradykinin receptor [Ornithorhynchus anatinus]|uniref:B1 bradykinin receptor n=1 Tax=Ornithorhynchus anatinus TaxID=9258 RepID=F6R303_ORNAN|nr:B1 bradykinin receptor [Ornithorhynchus anatinus]XP_007667552.1 B1 bradykinin receptor [Ornithorhynchus anatinus]
MATGAPLGLNFSNQSKDPRENATTCESSGWWEVLYEGLPPTLIVIFFFGLVGNIFVLSVFLLHKNRLTVAEIYLANLAAADLIFVISLPIWAKTIKNKFNWIFGESGCRGINGLIKANLFTSIFLVVAISLDRYWALVHTITSRRKRSRRRAQIICAVIWFAGGLLSIPTMVFRSVKHLPDLNVSACILDFPSPSWNNYKIIFLSVLGFVLPLLAIVFFNYQIITSLWGREDSKLKRSGEPKDSKATTLILTLVVIFLLCWTPYHLLSFFDFLFSKNVLKGCFWEDFIDLGIQLSTFLSFINSCLNPIIYVFVGKFFRAKVWEIYKQRFQRKFALSYESSEKKPTGFTLDVKTIL